MQHLAKVGRRFVIEAYAKYDCAKKNRPAPDLDSWDWSSADALDSELHCAGLKCCVLAAYLLWDKVALTLSDLRQCAVLARIFPCGRRKLGLIEEAGCLADWEPDRHTEWWARVADDYTFGESEPLILRPALLNESPASRYIEDGSGRAIALLKHHALFGEDQVLALAFLGSDPDKNSTFGRRKLWMES